MKITKKQKNEDKNFASGVNNGVSLYEEVTIIDISNIAKERIKYPSIFGNNPLESVEKIAGMCALINRLGFKVMKLNF